LASTIVNKAPEPTVTKTAKSIARPQPWCIAIAAVTVEETTPPRLPTVFMSAESDAEYPGARSMQEAQNPGVTDVGVSG